MQKPTDAELEILQVLWELGPSTVRAINERLNLRREVGYTTTLKFMQIMHEKGLVSRQDDSKTHIYKALVEESDTQSWLTRQFVANTFRGNTSKLVLQALGNHDASQAELDEIKALIAEIERKK